MNWTLLKLNGASRVLYHGLLQTRQFSTDRYVDLPSNSCFYDLPLHADYVDHTYWLGQLNLCMTWRSRHTCKPTTTAAAFSTLHACHELRGTGMPATIAAKGVLLSCTSAQFAVLPAACLNPQLAKSWMVLAMTGTACHVGKAWNQTCNIRCDSA